MGYVIAGILVVLIVAAAIGLWVRGATASDPEGADRRPDAGEPSSPGVGGVGQGGVGGEGEGSRPVPDSERLANRER